MRLITGVLFISFTLCNLNVLFCENTTRANNGSLAVVITGFKNNDGQAILYIYDSKDNFLKENAAFRKAVTTISNQRALVRFDNLPFGTYVISATHDENKNGKTDLNFLGFSSEGFGYSNYKRFLGFPDFDLFKIILQQKETNLFIQMRY